MIKKRLKLISDIKTVDDLQRLKLEKKYNRDLKKLELKASLIQLEANLSPEAIKDTLLFEGQSYVKQMALNYLPTFMYKMFNKNAN